jgi:predicted PhzF superfamily epimerase YddE/YHI9
MRTPIFQVDAFTTRRFAGNPAAVMPLDAFLPDVTLQEIAAENNLAETAFLVRGDGDYQLRWFTPATEVPLCGHATLASAAVVMERLEPGRTSVVFHSASGPLTVHRAGAGYVMDFPARPSERITPPAGLAEALGVVPIEVHAKRLQLSGSARERRGFAGNQPRYGCDRSPGPQRCNRDLPPGMGSSTLSAATLLRPREFPKIR